MKRTKDLAVLMGNAPMKEFDKTHKDLFKKMEAVADRFAEARDLAHDVVKESRQVFNSSDALEGILPRW